MFLQSCFNVTENHLAMIYTILKNSTKSNTNLKPYQNPTVTTVKPKREIKGHNCRAYQDIWEKIEFVAPFYQNIIKNVNEHSPLSKTFLTSGSWKDKNISPYSCNFFCLCKNENYSRFERKKNRHIWNRFHPRFCTEIP